MISMRGIFRESEKTADASRANVIVVGILQRHELKIAHQVPLTAQLAVKLAVLAKACRRDGEPLCYYRCIKCCSKLGRVRSSRNS